MAGDDGVRVICPERALACAIIGKAVKDWKRARPGSASYLELLEFFDGQWCRFLWGSVMDIPLEVALERLGVTAGVYDGGSGP